ncbi:MAG: GntR family transcriptional regulator [Thermoflexales bacterium]|nr:GntR family transcriptional regulator [Thermoflexales bacterium]
MPLYHQLKELLQQRIDAGEWRAGMRLPSERELCEQFGISRITVRQALAELEREGRLLRDQGRGTFVAQPRFEQHLTHLTSFTQDMLARGQKPGAVVLEHTVMMAPVDVAHDLHLDAEHRRVILLRRLRLANEQPVAVETAYLSEHMCPQLVAENLNHRSLYALLSERFGIVPTRAVQQMTATACPPTEARLLQIKPGNPVLHLRRVTYSQDGCPFEVVESFYRGDKYVFYAELRVETPQARESELRAVRNSG